MLKNYYTGARKTMGRKKTFYVIEKKTLSKIKNISHILNKSMGKLGSGTIASMQNEVEQIIKEVAHAIRPRTSRED